MVASLTGQQTLKRLVETRDDVTRQLTELMDKQGVDFVGASFAAVPQQRSPRWFVLFFAIFSRDSPVLETSLPGYPNGSGWLWTARKVVNQGNYGWCCGGLALSEKPNQPSERLLSVVGCLHRQANIDGVLAYTSRSLGSWPGNCIIIVANEDFLKTKNI